MYTEKEANLLWCPMVRHEGQNGSTFNRGSIDGKETNRMHEGDDRYICACIGSRCAGWRWYPSDTTHFEPFIEIQDSGRRTVTHKEVLDKPTRGFCGFAGNPL